jgi:hypothetical protein
MLSVCSLYRVEQSDDYRMKGYWSIPGVTPLSAWRTEENHLSISGVPAERAEGNFCVEKGPVGTHLK